MFILNPHSGVPIYRQITEQVRRMVASGQLESGTELPSIRDLAVKHAINPMTVSKAYALLESEGVLERHRGKPMTVAAAPVAGQSAGKRLTQLEPLVDQLVQAAQQLDLATDDVVEALNKRWEKLDDRSVRRRKSAQ